MFEKSKQKKKMSVDFDMKNYEIMNRYSSEHSITNGALINFLIENFISLDTQTKEMFSDSIVTYLETLDKSLLSAGKIERNYIQKTKNRLLNLLDFFTDGEGYFGKEIKDMKKSNMKRIDLKDGYAIVPQDWIELRNFNPVDCSFAGVVEVRNAVEYNIPHFVFFLKKPIYEMNEKDYQVINDECISKFPQFNEILNQQVEPEYDTNHNLINEELWRKAPTIGYFPISEYGTDTSYPYGAMIFKNQK